jgi:large subunit ribosomal protein L1
MSVSVAVVRGGKKIRAARAAVEKRAYGVEEAVDVLKKVHYAKFDETVELAFNLGVDPKHADQMVRATVVLPHGLGKTLRVAVIAGGEKLKEAEAAGADVVGGEDLVQKIQGGWMDFDAVISTPDMMKSVGKLGRVLGPRGLMPNPKAGSVTFDVAKAIAETKAGKVEFRVDKAGVVHAPAGRISFEAPKLVENVRALVGAVVRAKPPVAKGRYIKKITLSSTMGPGILIDPASVDAAV